MTTAPFDAAPRGTVIEHLGDDRWYAFDFAAPRGTVLLSGPAARRLRDLRTSTREVSPRVDGCESELDEALARHGLIDAPDIAPRPERDASSAKKERAFNVWLHATNACNFTCHYCYIPDLNRTVDPAVIERLSMSRSAVFPVLERLFSFCETNGFRRLHLKFAGGEPTLNLPLLEQFCAAARAHSSNVRVTFGMVSNGSFASEQLLPFLQKYDVKLSISLDGLGATHDRIRHLVPSASKPFSSWERICENIERLRAEGIPPYILFTLTSGNLPDLDDLADWCHSQQLGFRISLVRQRLAPSPALQERFSAALVSLYRRLGHSMPVQMRFERDARFAEWNLSKRKLLACGSCRNYVAVDQKGQVSTCQMTMDKPRGSLLENSMGSIMQGIKQAETTRMLANPELKTGACRRCRFFHVCAGGCPQHSHQVFGTFDTPSPWCSVYGTLAPVYVEAAARHLLRQALAIHAPQTCLAT